MEHEREGEGSKKQRERGREGGKGGEREGRRERNTGTRGKAWEYF